MAGIYFFFFVKFFVVMSGLYSSVNYLVILRVDL